MGRPAETHKKRIEELHGEDTIAVYKFLPLQCILLFCMWYDLPEKSGIITD